MATLNIPIPDELYARLQQLAKSQQRTIDSQLITLLQNALLPEAQQPQGETGNSVIEILDDIRRRREQLPTDIEWPDSTALIREDRDR